MQLDDINRPDSASKDTAPDRPGDPCVMVICGASGDLTKRKLIPAICNLAASNLLAREFAIVGVARAQQTSEAFRAQLANDIRSLDRKSTRLNSSHLGI